MIVMEEVNGSITVSIVRDIGNNPVYSLGATTIASTLMIDNDATSSTIAIADDSVTEGNAGDNRTLTFDVTMAQAAMNPITVNYAFGASGDTADLTDDYSDATTTETAGTLAFAAGETRKTITVDVVEDEINEDTETFTITLTLVGPDQGASFSDAVATGTISNDDRTLPVIKIADATGLEDDGTNNGKVTFTLSLTDSGGTPIAAGRDIMVNFATSDSSGRAAATVTTDYSSVDTMVTIDKGTMSEDVDVVTIFDGGQANNVKNESDEKFIVTLTNPDYATLFGGGTELTAEGTILSNDTPVFEIVDVEKLEGNDSNNNNMVFTVTLSSGATGTSTVEFATSNGTATAGSDFTATSGTVAASTALEFASGTQSQDIMVPILGDEINETDETFTVTLSEPSTGTALLGGSQSATGTIRNDDDATIPEISISSGAVATGVTERYKFEFTVTADSNVAADLDVTLAITDGAGTNLDILEGGGNIITIPRGKNSATGVIIAGSRVINPASKGQIQIMVTPVSGSYNADSNNDDIIVAVKDSDTGDATTPVVSLSGPTTVVEGQMVSYEISASHTPGTPPLTVFVNVGNSRGDFLVAGQAGERRVDITASDTPGTFNVTTKVDTTDGVDGLYFVSIVEKSDYALPRYQNNRSIGTAVIDPPAISITGGSAVDEGSGASFTLSSSSGAVTSNVRVQFGDGDDGFLSAAQKVIRTVPVGLFYRITEPTLHNSSTYSGGTITATILPDETSPATYTVGSPNPAMVTINNITIQPPAGPTASLDSAIVSSGVTRGHDFEIKVQLIPAASTDVEILYSVLNVGNKAPRLTSSTGYENSISGRITMPAGKNFARKIIGVERNFGGAVPSDAVYQVAIVSSDNYISGSTHTIDIPVRDNSAPTAARPVVSITPPDPADIIEGNDVTFMVKATPVPTSDLAVTVNVSSDNLPFIADPQNNLFDRTVTITGGNSTTPLTVSTQDATGFATIWAKVVQADGYILPIVESDLTGRTVTAGLENEMVEATAVVVEENFTVELSTTASMVDEGESIKVRLTPSIVPKNVTPVKIEITETGNDFVRSNIFGS